MGSQAHRGRSGRKVGLSAAEKGRKATVCTNPVKGGRLLAMSSKTGKDSFIVDRIFGLGGHYKTKISDGKKSATGLGRTPKESQKIASKKWDKVKGK